MLENVLTNVLEFVHAIVPSTNFGATLVVFIVLFRLVLHPLIKAQVKHGKQMHDLQPHMKKINEKYKSDPQTKAKKTSELFKKHEVKPLLSIIAIVVQVTFFLTLFQILRKLAEDPQALVGGSFPRVDFTLFGLVDLSRSTAGSPLYVPALILVTASAITQYFYGKQTIHERKKPENTGEHKAKMSQMEFQHHFGQFLKFAIPVVIFIFTYGIASVIALFWFLSGFIGYFQQKYILKDLKSID